MLTSKGSHTLIFLRCLSEFLLQRTRDPIHLWKMKGLNFDQSGNPTRNQGVPDGQAS